jgi:hypothetical protein
VCFNFLNLARNTQNKKGEPTLHFYFANLGWIGDLMLAYWMAILVEEDFYIRGRDLGPFLFSFWT